MHFNPILSNLIYIAPQSNAFISTHNTVAVSAHEYHVIAIALYSAAVLSSAILSRKYTLKPNEPNVYVHGYNLMIYSSYII